MNRNTVFIVDVSLWKSKKTNIATSPNSRQCKEQLPPHSFPSSPPSLLIEKLSKGTYCSLHKQKMFNQDEYLPYPDWDQSQNYFQNSKTTAMKDVLTYLNRASFTKV